MSIIWAASILNVGCSLIYDNDMDQDVVSDAERAQIILRVFKLTEGITRADNQKVIEAISSLRILITDESGKVEYNDIINADNLDSKSSPGEIYTLKLTTSPGIKRFFLFANEEETGTISYGGEVANNPTSLSELLNTFRTGETYPELFNIINSVYFTPNYTTNDNTIYLPYSSFYQITLEGGTRYEDPMYLIPAATKFTFNFNNSRSHDVTVDKIEISSLADRLFLLGQISPDSGDYFKTIKETNGDVETYYWVDWLARISEMSHNFIDYPENERFNNTFGWISSYEIPSGTIHSIAGISLSSSDNVVPAKTQTSSSTPIPGTLSMGPYYYPECRYIPAGDSNQAYSLNLELTDSNPAEQDSGHKIFNDIALPNVKALFRNTHVIITVSMSEGTDDIYVEIRNWYFTENFYGTATKEN